MCPDPSRLNPSSLLRNTMVYPDPALGWGPSSGERGVPKPMPVSPVSSAIPMAAYSRVGYFEDPTSSSASAAMTRGRGQWPLTYAPPAPSSGAVPLTKGEPETVNQAFEQGHGAAVAAFVAAHAAASAQARANAAAAAESATRATACASPASIQEQTVLRNFDCEPPEIDIEEDIFSESNGIVPVGEVPDALRQPSRPYPQLVPRENLGDSSALLLENTNVAPAGLPLQEKVFVEKRVENFDPQCGSFGPKPLLVPGTPEVVVKSENVLDSIPLVMSDCDMDQGEQGLPASLAGADEDVNRIVSDIFRDARSKAALAKVALRNRLKAEYSKAGHGHISPEQRAKIRSRREAAVSRQNKLVYARQLEAVVVRLVQQNQRLLKEQGAVKKEADTGVSY